MHRNLRTRIAIVLVVLLGSLWYLYPPKKAINLGLDLQDMPALGAGLSIADSRPSKTNETYSVPAGKWNPVHNECNAIAIDLTEAGRSARRLGIEARAYNDGVAFRYLIPDEPRTKDIRIVNEKTQFVITEDATMYPLILRNFQSSWEDNYRTLPVTGLHPEAVVGLPLLMELPGKAWLAITEADIENYAGMYLQHSTVENSRILEARLSPRVDEPGLAVTGQTPLRSPWRVIMIGDTPGRLIESNIVENLNPPSVIADTSWIKPGKAAWDWWSGPYDEGVAFKVGKNTATAKHYIDFASKSGFEYFMLDGGWAARKRRDTASAPARAEKFPAPSSRRRPRPRPGPRLVHRPPQRLQAPSPARDHAGVAAERDGQGAQGVAGAGTGRRQKTVVPLREAADASFRANFRFTLCRFLFWKLELLGWCAPLIGSRSTSN